MTGIYGRKFQLEAKEEVTHSSERKMNQRKRVSYSVQLLLLQVKKSWVAACEIKVNMIMLLIPSMLQACEGLGFPEMATDMPSGTLPRVGQNATGNQTRGSFFGPVKFDMVIMAIILMAILFILLSALAIRLILPQARRHGRRFPFESQESFAARLALIGLKNGNLKRIPTIIYRAGKTDIRGHDCPICLGEFVEGEMIRILPKCCHSFHVKCIDSWLKSKPSCPMCRESLHVSNILPAV